MNTTAGNTATHCAHCGRPCAVAVWIGSLPYHEECTHGPAWQQPQYLPPTFYPPARTFTVPHVPLQEDDVRRIVREELKAAAWKPVGETPSALDNLPPRV